MNEVNPRFLATTIITLVFCVIAGLATWLLWHDLVTTIAIIILTYFIVTLIASVFTNPRSWWDD